jgi:hypothetical protein
LRRWRERTSSSISYDERLELGLGPGGEDAAAEAEAKAKVGSSGGGDRRDAAQRPRACSRCAPQATSAVNNN